MKKQYRSAAKFPSLKHWLGIAVALVLIGIFVAYYFWPNEGTVGGQTAELNKKLDDSATQEIPEPQFPPRKLRQAWYETSAKDAKMLTRPKDIPDDSSFVTLTGEYDQWLLGTPVEISIPQTGKRYRSIVDRIAPDELGNMIIHAKPDTDEEEFLRLIVTYSSTQTSAYVSTTLGSYQLTGSEKRGWLTSKDLKETQRDRHATTKFVPPRED